jgi:hypothetical protein
VSRDDGGEEFRFDAAELDGAAARSGFDPVPAVIGVAVGVGGLLFLAEPFVEPVPVGGLRLPAAFLSVLFVGAGLLFGCSVYLRRGRWRLGVAHGVGGAGWTFVAVGTVLRSGPLLLVGLAVLVGGCVGLVAMVSRLPR